MPQVLIHTIGHSDHETVAFIALLRQHDIALVVDVRSQPYSRWTPQFNRETLKRDLEEAGIAYRFMGHALGGRPSNPALYDGESPDYTQMEQTSTHQAGIDRLLDLARAERVIIRNCGKAAPPADREEGLLNWATLRSVSGIVPVEPSNATLTNPWKSGAMGQMSAASL